MPKRAWIVTIIFALALAGLWWYYRRDRLKSAGGNTPDSGGNDQKTGCQDPVPYGNSEPCETVMLAQRAVNFYLKALGEPLIEEDGFYGPITRAGIRRFGLPESMETRLYQNII